MRLRMRREADLLRGGHEDALQSIGIPLEGGESLHGFEAYPVLLREIVVLEIRPWSKFYGRRKALNVILTPVTGFRGGSSRDQTARERIGVEEGRVIQECEVGVEERGAFQECVYRRGMD
jgi:hypothetical protein